MTSALVSIPDSCTNSALTFEIFSTLTVPPFDDTHAYAAGSSKALPIAWLVAFFSGESSSLLVSGDDPVLLVVVFANALEFSCSYKACMLLISMT